MNSAWKTPQKVWLLQKNRALCMKIYRQLMVASPGKLKVQNMNKLNKSCFGSLSIINRYDYISKISINVYRGFLVAKFSKIVGSRAGIYRLLLVGRDYNGIIKCLILLSLFNTFDRNCFGVSVHR